MAITLRTVTGSALSYLQVDTNFSSYYYSSSISGSTVTFFKTGSVAIGEPPSSSSITLPLPSKWTDITGGIQRTSLVRVVGPFAQGNSNVSAAGVNSHAEGESTTASNTGSHAEGFSSVASGQYSHAEGRQTQATEIGTHAEGYLTEASGQYAHAEGRDTLAFMTGSHAEGLSTQARGLYSHAEGDTTQAIGDYSHAEGGGTQAIGNYSHAEGLETIASGLYQHVQGQFNLTSPMQGAFIIGNGISAGSRSNLVHASGSQFQITGSLNVSGSVTATAGVNIGGLTTLSNDGFNLYNTNGNINFYRNQCKLQFTIGNDDTGAPIQIGSDNTAGLQISSSGYLHLSASVVGIDNILRLTPRTTTPTPVEGMVIASGSAGASTLYYYNGTTWNALF